MKLSEKIFGTRSSREIKKINDLVDKIMSMEDEYAALSDAELKAKTPQLKARLENGETLDDILPEAFAAIREADWRVLGMRPYRVQIIGGIILHQGRIAEMKTGEGKTLVATLPAYLNALGGKGVHIVTVNDYLARRDSEWMGKAHRFMGLKVGLIVHGLSSDERRQAYAADITYGTNNELGFDYLRDNMAIYKQNMVQRGHSFAIVDEVDSILIDEARTPLIISGKGESSSELYKAADRFVAGLKKMVFATIDTKADETDDLECDYVIDEKAKTATLTQRGIKKAENAFGLENLSDPENSTIVHHINQAMKARGIMKRDIDYVVRDGEVIIVDEFTGRLMFGRRYNEGLHQAIEAKENVTVAHESKTLATITFQNFFRLYDKLSGMTGTALTEEEEFGHIYNLDVVEIPTNKPLARMGDPDVVYKTEAGKLRAVISQIKECHAKGQPVLVGTVSIEKSEQLSALLKREKIPHVVLNAKHHEKEAEIVAQAGKLGAVTIATNMAGRGTDIMLGGNAEYMAKNDLRRAGMEDELIAEATGYADTDNTEILDARAQFAQAYKAHSAITSAEAEKVRAAGGLFIIGTERHDSRRIDNQLRGRAGRQGDPGQTRFYLSMDDDIMRLFGGDRLMNIMETLKIDEDTPIDAKILSNSIENAQHRVESRNFQSRKTVLEYDDVMNLQRKIIYEERRRVLDGENIRDNIISMIHSSIDAAVSRFTDENGNIDRADYERVRRSYEGLFLRRDELYLTESQAAAATPAEMAEKLTERAIAVYEEKEQVLTEPIMREVERVMLLRSVDEYWMDHIDAMHELRQGVSLRGYAQTDPVVEYKREGFEMFDEMNRAIREETVRRVYLARVQRGEEVKRQEVAKVTGASGATDGSVKRQPVKNTNKVGRNDPCPCGSGKKYKKCCGMNQ
ncbi:MAG: preprotein translocase subunit SecA [Oscillospiraceae bacterium]|nr:preprotein translocase subunit SecA [Oscillospiraceae bacterium]